MLSWEGVLRDVNTRCFLDPLLRREPHVGGTSRGRSETPLLSRDDGSGHLVEVANAKEVRLERVEVEGGSGRGSDHRKSWTSLTNRED